MTSKRHLTLILNPKSGTLSKKGVDKWVARHLRRHGYDVRVEFTKAPGHATELAREAVERGDYGVLACGGDGTVNEVATGLIGTATALGIIPAGSGNGLARHIGIPVDVKQSMRVILADNPQACDYGTVNGRPFFCTFGMGFDAAVSKAFSRKHRRGLNSYISSALDEFVKYKPDTYTITVGDETITERAFIVVVANASQYGNNAFIAPAASIQDGQLDVTIVHDGKLLEKVWTGVEMLAGAIGNHGKIQTMRTNRLKITRKSDTVAHIDGEPVNMPMELDVECHPGRLNVFVPRHSIRMIPVLTPLWLTISEWALVLTRPFRSIKEE
ncbi:MAG: diacylglycerol kinase family lipid kinase [Muribaculaceae bacterium]|nr:diacylglycerol kinase family lipid kinase [Muribaculaceae bacterium]